MLTRGIGFNLTSRQEFIACPQMEQIFAMTNELNWEFSFIGVKMTRASLGIVRRKRCTCHTNRILVAGDRLYQQNMGRSDCVSDFATLPDPTN